VFLDSAPTNVAGKPVISGLIRRGGYEKQRELVHAQFLVSFRQLIAGVRGAARRRLIARGTRLRRINGMSERCAIPSSWVDSNRPRAVIGHAKFTAAKQTFVI
jgi:hypothetical protein